MCVIGEGKCCRLAEGTYWEPLTSSYRWTMTKTNICVSVEVQKHVVVVDVVAVEIFYFFLYCFLFFYYFFLTLFFVFNHLCCHRVIVFSSECVLFRGTVNETSRLYIAILPV